MAIASMCGLALFRMWNWLLLIGKIVLSIFLIFNIVGGGLFAYICFKAGAKAWSAACIVITAVSILVFLWVILEQLPFYMAVSLPRAHI